IGVPCHRRAAGCCGQNSTSKEEWNKELGTRHRGPGTARPTVLFHTHLQAWDMATDRIAVDRPAPGIEQILATPSGCVIIAHGRTRLFDARARSSVELGADRGRATAIAWSAVRAVGHGRNRGNDATNGTGSILVAAGSAVLAFDEQGAETMVLASDVGQTAVGSVGSMVVSGFDDGSIQLLSDSPGHDGQQPIRSFAFESMPASAVTRILEGPPGTLVAGYSSGFLGIWSLENGALLDSAKLHGPVTHLLLEAADCTRSPSLATMSC
ncbi:MAG: hypothetical protein V2A73_12360, partial [Pseudomonadota bacterium]